MKTSQVGLALIKHYEGFRSKPYKCPAGRWTIGYGHLIGDGLSLPDNWNRHFTIEEINDLLKRDLVKFERGVLRYITVSINQYQFDALVSFSFNLGLGTLQRSQVRQKINRGDFKGAALRLLKYNKAGGIVLKGLTLRRQDEAKLLNSF
jgi:lysozyme